ncbi:nucleotidyltransferase family protein [uncultured Nostoc sp.]|uniref:nucleotidyltransferase family protein n=1 Tax=uncultured Nostoc sp. TaxID=340711 RepID=UPI0035CB0BA2
MEIQQSPQFINHIVSSLRSIEGITAIALGGSRARGNHNNKSDVDLGIYYNPENPPDLIALNRLACELDDNHRVNLITAIGEWGKWINGGGWLVVEGVGIDFIYRDLANAKSINEAIAIIEAIEDDLSQWYGNQRLAM